MLGSAMRVLLLLPLLLACPPLVADCLSPEQAAAKVGAITCIRGNVVKVVHTESGTHFLNYCDDYRQCPFTVVVFRRDLRHVGDIRQLQGRVVDVYGKVQLYGGRAEIILREARQLRGEAAQLPPLPKNYDVERHGRYSAGRFGYPTTKHGRGRRGTQGLQQLSNTNAATTADAPLAPDDPLEKR
jgi:rRNA processing protein Gar1